MKRLIRLVLLLEMTLVLATAQATSMMRPVFVVEFPEAIRASAVVAWVEIDRAEPMATPSGESCGTRYTARVVKHIKGVVPDQRIEFAHYAGRAVGGQYFVFLDETADMLRQTVSKSGFRPASRPEDCAASLPRYAETGDGLGTIAVQHGEQASSKPAIQLEGPPYAIPAALVGTRPHEGWIGDGLFFGKIQIEAPAFLDYLRSLAGTCDKRPATRLADLCL